MKALREHCMVNLNKTHVFVGGGFGSRSAYLYDWGADAWSDLPDIPTEVSLYVAASHSIEDS